MSKRSRLKQQRKQEALRRRSEQQAALSQGTAPEGMGRPSIAQLVLQRMDKLGVVQQVDAAVNGHGTTTHTPTKPHIKLTPGVDQKGMPTVAAPQEPWPENWPACPSHVDAVEWRRALENKEYYELKEIECDGKKPWFQHPKHSYQYSEFVFCTPEMMQTMLTLLTPEEAEEVKRILSLKEAPKYKYMPVNRPWKEAWSDTIARDVKNERWLQTHESIAINKLGNMHDGQHRAWGIIKAGRGWPIYMTWNVPPEAIYVTDSGDKRKINEKLGLLFPNSKLTHKTAALCRAMMWGLTSRGIRYSESEIAEFAVKHHPVVLWLATNLRGYRADLQAVIGKALLWWGEDVVGPFIRRMKKISFQGEDDPAKALYLYLQKAKQEGRRASYANPMVYYKKTLAAIYAAAAGKGAKKIYQKQDDIFEWAGGWDVPDGAPCAGKVLTGWWDANSSDDKDDGSAEDDTEE